MLSERQPLGYHKRPYALTSTSLLLLGCLSLVLFSNTAYAQSPGINVPTGLSTQNTYCSNGTCSTGSIPILNKPTNNFKVLTFPAIHQNLIGIQLSGTCLTYAKNNINSSCYTYKDLISLDNTNKFLAGQFVTYPYFHRLPSLVKNFWAFDNSSIIMVDPSNEFTVNARMITVNIKNFTWINKSDNGTNGGQSVKYHIDRRMIGCNEAQVSSNYTLIKDTISYMESGCTTTGFNDTKIITQKAISFNYNNPYSTLHLANYLGQIFNHHTYFTGNHTSAGLGPSDCIRHQCSYTDPYAKQGYK